jgi:hypothetical protein
MTVNFSGKIFFDIPKQCLPPRPPEATGLVHPLVCLGEGLRALGIDFYANADYWRLSPNTEEYLFRYDSRVQPEDCSIIVVNVGWIESNRQLSEKLLAANRKYIVVCFDDADGSNTPSWNSEYRQFDFIFKAHYNSKLWFPSNIYPSAFGLSERILKATNNITDFSQRKRNLIVNFRPAKSFNHSVRESVGKEFLPRIQEVLPINDSVDATNAHPSDPYDCLQWSQTGRRHYPNYYKRLLDSAACACFGGFFVPPFPRNQSSFMNRALKLSFSKLGLKSNRIIQWDSWRFWESLAAGCATFHVDFDKYGCQLPVMPENWQHYIGIDLDNIQEAIDRINADPKILERVSVEGRRWALEHYSPVPTTLRFLKTVCENAAVKVDFEQNLQVPSSQGY